MNQFRGVRLRRGTGSVNSHNGAITMPLDGESFHFAPLEDDESYEPHVGAPPAPKEL